MKTPDAQIPDNPSPLKSNTLSVPRRRETQSFQMTDGVAFDTGRHVDSIGQLATDHSGKAASLASFVEILFVHKYLLMWSLLISLAMGWIALLVWPRSYESEAKLILRIGRESVSLDPTATTSQTMMFQKTQEEEINSALEILGSRHLRERIVEEIGAAPIIDGSLPSPETKVPSSFEANLNRLKEQAAAVAGKLIAASGIRDPISDHERAVIQLQESLEIYAPKKSTAIVLRAEAKTPEMAQTIARSLTEHFLDEHVNVSLTKGSFTFFSTQVVEAEKKLHEMMLRRSNMLQERKMASVESRHLALTTQLGDIERKLLESQTALQQYLAEIGDLSEKVSKTENEIVAAKQKQGDQTWSTMRNTLYELEMEEKRLSSQYTPGHSRLVQLREQVAGAKEILGKLESEREDASTTPNPVKIRIEEDLQQTRTAVVGLQSLIAETEMQWAAKQNEIRELLDFEVELGQLDREIASSESSLEILHAKQEEARVIDELQAQHISSIGVFQPATFVEKAVSPKKSLVAIAFAALGLLGGLGWVLVREATASTLRTPEQVEANLGRSVLATIPYSRKLKRMQRLVKANSMSSIRVGCRSILSEVLLSRPQSNRQRFGGQTIGILGVDDGCGASSMAVGLAMASSEDAGLRTTLIDFDLTNRTVSRAFGLNGAPGFAELISGAAGREDCTQHFEQRPLNLISGSSAKSSRRIEADPMAVAGVLKELLDQNDVVIVDLPPASRPDQTLMIAQHLDQVLVVVESEKSDIVAMKRLLRQLQAGDTNVAGIVLNKTRNYLPRWLARLLR